MTTPTKSSSVAAYLLLLRPKQWTKNLLVFAALLFTGSYKDAQAVTLALIAFGAMCAASSATYIFNDIQDADLDRLHPKKRRRPIAAGLVSSGSASAIGLLLLVLSLALAFYLGTAPLLVLAAYLAIQVLYNLGLKKVPVADVFAIAAGFVLRAGMGAAALDVSISGWLLFCTGALALMLGFGKRRNEYVTQGEDRTATRQSLVHYNLTALDALVCMFGTAAALCYGIYTLQSQTATKYPGIIMTAPFVVYGITRYVLLVFTVDEGGEPEDLLLKDPHIIACVLLFVVAAALAVSGYRLPLVER